MVPPLQASPLWQGFALRQQAWPAAPHATHMPGVPLVELRPMQVNPVPVQVPKAPLPQQGCPSAPQVPHWAPDVLSKHPIEPVQAVTPPSVCPKVVVQQASPAPPQAPQVPPEV